MDGERQAVMTLARDILAKDLRCMPDAIHVVAVEHVEWNDSALGCPEVGMMYMQVITPGYRVVLEHDRQQYTVHTDRGRRAVRCNATEHSNMDQLL